VLKSLPLGTAVKIDGPGGSLTLHKNSPKPAVKMIVVAGADEDDIRIEDFLGY